MNRIAIAIIALAAGIGGCAPQFTEVDQLAIEASVATELAAHISGIKGEQPSPVPTPAPPSDECTNCKTSNWPGWLGDGQPRTPCPECNADGKIKPIPRSSDQKATKFFSKQSDLVLIQR